MDHKAAITLDEAAAHVLLRSLNDRRQKIEGGACPHMTPGQAAEELRQIAAIRDAASNALSSIYSQRRNAPAI